MHALLACLLIVCAYVAPFYLQKKLSRSHTNTILSRSIAAVLICAFAWLPLFQAVKNLQV